MVEGPAKGCETFENAVLCGRRARESHFQECYIVEEPRIQAFENSVWEKKPGNPTSKMVEGPSHTTFHNTV